MFRRSASLAIAHRTRFAALPSVSRARVDTRIAMFQCHANDVSQAVHIARFESVAESQPHHAIHGH